MLPKNVTAAIDRASVSSVMRISWPERGRAPAGFVKGMAAVFAILYARLKVNDQAVLAMVRVVDEPGKHDVFDVLEQHLLAQGMKTGDASMRDRLRYLFVVMYGLGMRESSGRYCCGRDTTAVLEVSAETAEAGPFQTSWDLRGASPEIVRLFDISRGKKVDDFKDMLDVWKEGVIQKPADSQSFGSGQGLWFQVACKTDMEFAVQVAALGLRNRCTAWGPVNRKEVAILSGVDTLLLDIQNFIDAEKPTAPAAKSWSTIIAEIIGSWFSSKPKVPAAPTVPLPLPVPAPPLTRPTPVPTVASPNPIWMRQGMKEVGFHEVGVNRGIERYIELGKSGQLGDPWCAIFVNAMLEFAGVTGSRSAAAYSFEVNRNFIRLDGPAYGAVVTMWRDNPRKAGQQGNGHVGFYIGEGPEGVILLDGNDGDGVRISAPKSRIRVVGYYWPMGMPLPKIGAIPYDARVAAQQQQGQKET